MDSNFSLDQLDAAPPWLDYPSMDGEESWHLKLCLSAIFFNGVIVRRSNKITVSDINDVTDTLILPVSSADPYSAFTFTLWNWGVRACTWGTCEQAKLCMFRTPLLDVERLCFCHQPQLTSWIVRKGRGLPMLSWCSRGLDEWSLAFLFETVRAFMWAMS